MGLCDIVLCPCVAPREEVREGGKGRGGRRRIWWPRRSRCCSPWRGRARNQASSGYGVGEGVRHKGLDMMSGVKGS